MAMSIERLLHSLIPHAILAADRLRPALGFRWPGVRGGGPPYDVMQRYDRYDATAFALRLRTQRLQSDVMAVEGSRLDGYVRDHVVADVAALRGWMRAERGAIFACPHYGPFLAGALLFASLGTASNRSHVFYDPADANPENGRFDELFGRFSERLNVLHNEPRDLVRAARALRNGQCISIMFDVVQRATDSMLVPFFGRLYPVMGGAAYLSLQSGAPLIPAYVMPGTGQTCEVLFGEPILPQDYASPDRDQNVYDMTCALFRDFQEQLIIAPWHWIYWENVARAPTFDSRVLHDRALMGKELRERTSSMPALLDTVPALRELLDVEN